MAQFWRSEERKKAKAMMYQLEPWLISSRRYPSSILIHKKNVRSVPNILPYGLLVAGMAFFVLFAAEGLEVLSFLFGG